MPRTLASPLISCCLWLLVSCTSRAAIQPEETAMPSVPPVATSTTKHADAACPITQPPKIAFVPPAPYPARPPAAYPGHFWYGGPALWTMLAPNGTWDALPHDSAGYTQKVFWWRQAYSMDAEPVPGLSVTGSRLDATGLTFKASRATNASADFGDAMLIGVVIPTIGCWEITGHYHGQSLSFVVRVLP